VKKILVIPVIGLFVLSGMQLTIATHFCRELVTHTEIAFAGHEPGCGMESDKPLTDIPVFSTSCCRNSILAFNVDQNYVPSDFHPFIKTLTDTQVMELPYSSLPVNNLICDSGADSSPPGFHFFPNTVHIADIQVFRI
jgi:hypothetical protein